jgi:hypothetical protein
MVLFETLCSSIADLVWEQSTIELPFLRSAQPLPAHIRARLHRANEVLTTTNPEDIKRLLEQVLKFHRYHVLIPEDSMWIGTFIGRARQCAMHRGLGCEEFTRYYILLA